MFEDKQGQPAKPAATPAKTEAGETQIVIHTMPKEFYDREVKMKEEPKPAAPKPVAAVPVVPPTALPPVAKPQATIVAPRRRSKLGLVMLLLLVIVLLAAGAVAVAYTQGLLPWKPVVTPAGTTEPEVIEPEPEPDGEEVLPEPEPVKPVSGADTDSDGLSNVEELLYGTDFRNPDSDGDTFLDGNEVFHRFDPRGLAPSTLLDTGAVRVLENAEVPFTIFYPTTWNPVSTPASQRVTFRSATGAGVNVLWQDKTAELPLADWYTAQVGEVAINRLQPTTTKEGYEALIGPDERVMYVDAGTRVYTLIYDLGDAKSIEFLQTFKMMVNSFKLVP